MQAAWTHPLLSHNLLQPQDCLSAKTIKPGKRDKLQIWWVFLFHTPQVYHPERWLSGVLSCPGFWGPHSAPGAAISNNMCRRKRQRLKWKRIRKKWDWADIKYILKRKPSIFVFKCLGFKDDGLFYGNELFCALFWDGWSAVALARENHC